MPAGVRLAGQWRATAVHPALYLWFFCQQPAAVRCVVYPHTRQPVGGEGVLHLAFGVQPADHLAGLERARRPVFYGPRQAPVRPVGRRGQPGWPQRADPGRYWWRRWAMPGCCCWRRYSCSAASGQACFCSAGGDGIRCRRMPASGDAARPLGGLRPGRCHCGTALALSVGHCAVRGVTGKCQYLPVLRAGTHRQPDFHRPYPAKPRCSA